MHAYNEQVFLSLSAKTPNIDNKDIKCDENKKICYLETEKGSQSSRRDKHALLHPKLLVKHFGANVLSILYVESILEYLNKNITVA